MFGKFFASTFTGSMFGAGTDVFAVWGYVIANTVNSTVELNPLLLAAILGSTTEKIQQAINELCEPDPHSRNSTAEGRRLTKEGQYQYRVTSHQLYRAVRNEEDRREYNRKKQQEFRARQTKLSNDVKPIVIDNHRMSTLSAHTEAEAEAEAEAEVIKNPPVCVIPPVIGDNGNGHTHEHRDEQWEQFKAAYPAKRRSAGYMANQRFLAACEKVGFPKLMTALELHKHSEDWKKGMVPGLEKWLEQELWIQEPENASDKSTEIGRAHLRELERRRAEKR